MYKVSKCTILFFTYQIFAPIFSVTKIFSIQSHTPVYTALIRKVSRLRRSNNF